MAFVPSRERLQDPVAVSWVVSRIEHCVGWNDARVDELVALLDDDVVEGLLSGEPGWDGMALTLLEVVPARRLAGWTDALLRRWSALAPPVAKAALATLAELNPPKLVSTLVSYLQGERRPPLLVAEGLAAAAARLGAAARPAAEALLACPAPPNAPPAEPPADPDAAPDDGPDDEAAARWGDAVMVAAAGTGLHDEAARRAVDILEEAGPYDDEDFVASATMVRLARACDPRMVGLLRAHFGSYLPTLAATPELFAPAAPLASVDRLLALPPTLRLDAARALLPADDAAAHPMVRQAHALLGRIGHLPAGAAAEFDMLSAFVVAAVLAPHRLDASALADVAPARLVVVAGSPLVADEWDGLAEAWRAMPVTERVSAARYPLDLDSSTAEDALELLGRDGSPEALELLAETLRDAPGHRAPLVLFALARYGRLAEAIVLGWLDESAPEDPWIDAYAILAAIGGDATREWLVERFESVHSSAERIHEWAAVAASLVDERLLVLLDTAQATTPLSRNDVYEARAAFGAEPGGTAEPWDEIRAGWARRVELAEEDDGIDDLSELMDDISLGSFDDPFDDDDPFGDDPFDDDDPFGDDPSDDDARALDPWLPAAPRVESTTVTRATPKIGRNEPCPCGSGKKYKKCCLNK